MRFIGPLAAFFCLGIYCFFRGFRFLQHYHTFADAPLTPIRGAAMGFVEVSGTAHGNETVASPVTHTPCYFYQVKIERWHEGGRGSGWAACATDSDGVRFYLEDETGRILVDAQDAQVDLHDPCQTEVTRALFSAGEADRPVPSYMPPTQDDLVEYISRVGSGARTAAFQSADPLLEYRVNPPRQKARGRSLGGALEILPRSGVVGYAASPDRYRLTENCIVPEKRYTVAGTCAENPRPPNEVDRNLILKGEDESTFLISDESKADLQSIAGWRSAKYIFGGAILTVASAALLLQSIGWLQSDLLARILR